MDRGNCLCKYCTKRAQKEISYSLGLSRPSPSSTPQPTARVRRIPAPKPPHASLRKPPKPEPLPHPGPTQALTAEKDSDIRDCLTRREVQGIRYFRHAELVWCALSNPIRPAHSDNDDDEIEFWPGIIETATTKAKAVPLDPASIRDNTADDEPDDVFGPLTMDAPKPRITWKPVQTRAYQVKLLATTHTCTLSDDDLLPYLAHAPSNTIINTLKNYLPHAFRTKAAQELASDSKKYSDFNPFADDVPQAGPAVDARFIEAIVPFSLAVQIASNVAGFWTPTDEWDYKYTISVPAYSGELSPSQAPSQAPSLHDVMNAHTNGTLSESVSAVASSSALMVQKNVTQLRYQGLWWGAERIWTEELVRLKLARCQFAPRGTDIVYPPAGPSKTTQQWNEEHGVPTNEQTSGAGEKGLFMKIDGLFVVDVDDKGGAGRVKECRASGMIYELVDQDWVNEEVHAVSTNGKGKERATEESISAPAAPQTAADASSPSKPARPVLSAMYPLPDPPIGYKFNPILTPGNEVVLSLSLISGRYYPHLFTHPRLRKSLQKAALVTEEDGGLYLNKHIWAMQGLLPGVHQSMDPSFWKDRRVTMFEEADRQARESFRESRAQALAIAKGEDHSMHDVFHPEPGPSQSISAAGSSISAHM